MKSSAFFTAIVNKFNLTNLNIDIPRDVNIFKDERALLKLGTMAIGSGSACEKCIDLNKDKYPLYTSGKESVILQNQISKKCEISSYSSVYYIVDEYEDIEIEYCIVCEIPFYACIKTDGSHSLMELDNIAVDSIIRLIKKNSMSEKDKECVLLLMKYIVDLSVLNRVIAEIYPDFPIQLV